MRDVDPFARPYFEDRPRDRKSVSGTDHCRQCPFASLWVGALGRERSDPAALGEEQGRFDRIFSSLLAGRGGIGCFNSREA